MNNPNNNLLDEVRWIAERFEFIDLTLEMPKAYPDNINVALLRSLIGKKNLPVVGHTPWYLPVGAPITELREYAINEFKKCLEVFKTLGVKKATIHFEKWDQLNDKKAVEYNIWTFKRLVAAGHRRGIDVMAENTPGLFSNPGVLLHVFKKIPHLYLHLDIGHANIGFNTNQSPNIIKSLSKRITHVHISDNSGKGDEHLAVGRGNINWPKMLGALKLHNYDGTITLEVFTSRRDLMNSKLKVRQIWDDL